MVKNEIGICRVALALTLAGAVACGEDSPAYMGGGDGDGVGTGGMVGGDGDTGTGGGMNGTGGTNVGSGGTGGDGDGGDGDGTANGDCAGGMPKEGMCKATAEGVYAIKTVIDVWWQGMVADPGRGLITAYLKGNLSDVSEDGSCGSGEVMACGTTLPAFTSDATCDAYQIEFPNDMWEKPGMPKFTTTGSTTGFNPGDILTLNPAWGLLGIDLNDPAGVFPTPMETATLTCPSGSGADCFPDHDGDGFPGITAKIRNDGAVFSPDGMPNGCGSLVLPGQRGPMPFNYRAAPTSVDLASAGGGGGGRRAEFVHVGFRTKLGGKGAIGGDCASGVGEGEADGMESRAFSCQAEAGDACTPAEAQFVDENTPEFNILAKGETPPNNVFFPAGLGGGPLSDTGVSKGVQSALVRLGDLGTTVTCEQVRNAAFPAFP